MPLTFAHPAAALPLRRAGLSFLPLVIGSMAPDALYFAHLTALGGDAHAFPGLLTIALPVGGAVLWLFDRVMRAPLGELMPAGVQARTGAMPRRAPFASVRATVWTVLALAAGAGSHALWDSFTHRSRWGVERLPALRHLVDLGPLGEVPLYRVAQHASTLVGFVALGVAFRLWYARAPSAAATPRLSARARTLRIAAILGVALAVGVTVGWTEAARYSGAQHVRHAFAWNLATLAPATAFVLALCYSLASPLRRRR